MSDFKSIIDAVKRIETTLIGQFGAEGRGLHEKLSSVEERIPPNLQRTIRYLATVRNKAMHEDGYEIEDPAVYVQQATQVHTQLLALASQRATRGTANPSATTAGIAVARTLKQPNKQIVIIIGALIFGFAWYFANVIQSKWDASADQDASVVAEVEERVEDDYAPSPVSKVQRKRSAESQASTSDLVTEGPKRNSTEITDSRRSAPDTVTTNSADEVFVLEPATTSVSVLKDSVAAGKHVGIGNGALSVDGVQFDIKKGTWNNLTPQITLTVTNMSDKTVSSGRAEAMLFLNGQNSPSVQAKELFLYFGNRGLPAGESRDVQIPLDRKYDWRAPDVLNASQHVVAVRVNSTDDGINRKFGGSAPALPWGVAATKPREVNSEPQDVDMRSKIAAGNDVGAGNAAVRLGTPTIKFGTGAFGRDIEISVEVENVSQRTVSWIKADALLFINGDVEPVIGDQEIVNFYLGERGLAAGERRRVKGTIDSSKTYQWSVPDVLSAKSWLLALRVVKTDDGMRQAFGGTAKPFPWRMPK